MIGPFISQWRKFLLWFLIFGPGAYHGPKYLATEHNEIITIGGCKIIVRPGDDS